MVTAELLRGSLERRWEVEVASDVAAVSHETDGGDGRGELLAPKALQK